MPDIVADELLYEIAKNGYLVGFERNSTRGDQAPRDLVTIRNENGEVLLNGYTKSYIEFPLVAFHETVRLGHLLFLYDDANNHSIYRLSGAGRERIGL